MLFQNTFCLGLNQTRMETCRVSYGRVRRFWSQSHPPLPLHPPLLLEEVETTTAPRVNCHLIQRGTFIFISRAVTASNANTSVQHAGLHSGELCDAKNASSRPLWYSMSHKEKKWVGGGGSLNFWRQRSQCLKSEWMNEEQVSHPYFLVCQRVTFITTGTSTCNEPRKRFS